MPGRDKGSGQVRIIGGVWRRRLLPVPALPGLRPSPDRVRETLFNWLAPRLSGARCLDLFAGSGALGFEALSRGAAATTFVERDPRAAAVLTASARTLAASGADIVQGEALEVLATLPRAAFDIIFLDPPYASDLVLEALTGALGHGILAPGGWFYLETQGPARPDLPPTLRWHKSARAGAVAFGLAEPIEDLP